MVGIYVIVVIGMINARRPDPLARQIGRIFTILFLGQLASGSLNVILLAPVWMQLWHLFLSDLLWILLVLFAATAFARRVPQVNSIDLRRPSPQIGGTA
jgi:heme A synthase